MKCQERAGFLIPRPCQSESTVHCSVCSKPVCGQHTASLPHGGLACTSCAAAQNVGPGVAARQYRDYYGYYSVPHMNVGGMGSGIAYTQSDYDAFEAASFLDPEEERRMQLEGS